MVSANVSARKEMIAIMVPITIKGVLRPFLLLQRSEIEPKRGSRKSASTLSSAMMIPDRVWLMPNLFVRMMGIMLS